MLPFVTSHKAPPNDSFGNQGSTAHNSSQRHSPLHQVARGAMLGLPQRELSKHRSCLLDQGLQPLRVAWWLFFHRECGEVRVAQRTSWTASTRGHCRMKWPLSYARKGARPQRNTSPNSQLQSRRKGYSEYSLTTNIVDPGHEDKWRLTRVLIILNSSIKLQDLI